MINKFVETENVREFHSKIAEVNRRGAEEACIVVVDGAPGHGKTTCMQRWIAQTGSVYVRAQPQWDYTWLVDALLKDMDIIPPHSRIARFERLLTGLDDRARASAQEGHTFGVVIDECDGISAKGEVMQAIRGMSDIQLMPTVLVGMGKLRDNLRRFPEIESRAPRKVNFKPATLDDTRKLFEACSEVKVATDLCQFVWKAAKGFNRETVDAIPNIERVGLRLDVGENGVTLADMEGQVILMDRATGKPIYGPKVFS